MTDLRIVREVSSVSRATDDDKWMNLRGTRDGSMITADWFLGMAMEGRCFGVNNALDTTPDTFNAAYADAQQDLYITVPSGITIIPVFIQINMEDTGTQAEMDILAVAGSSYDRTGVSSSTTPTIFNMRMDAPHASLCVAEA
ncbi:hypothetical protein LCGC14_2506340, partial [marine sediment metagenome]